MFKYAINIVWSDEDEGYIATIPEFNNLSAFGKTYEKALKEAKIAAEGYIETLQAENLPVPECQKLSNYSGQIRLRMPRDLHQKLTAEAYNQSMSLNSYMVYLLTMNYTADKMLSLKPRVEKHIYVLGSQGSKSINRVFSLAEDKRDSDVLKGEKIGEITSYFGFSVEEN